MLLRSPTKCMRSLEIVCVRSQNVRSLNYFAFTHKMYEFPRDTWRLLTKRMRSNEILCVRWQNVYSPELLWIRSQNICVILKYFAFAHKTYAFRWNTLYFAFNHKTYAFWRYLAFALKTYAFPWNTYRTFLHSLTKSMRFPEILCIHSENICVPEILYVRSQNICVSLKYFLFTCKSYYYSWDILRNHFKNILSTQNVCMACVCVYS